MWSLPFKHAAESAKVVFFPLHVLQRVINYHFKSITLLIKMYFPNVGPCIAFKTFLHLTILELLKVKNGACVEYTYQWRSFHTIYMRGAGRMDFNSLFLST